MRNIRIRNHVNIPIDDKKIIISFIYLSNLTKEHIAIVIGEIDVTKLVMFRIRLECLTSDVFGSHRCDCGAHLKDAIRKIDQKGNGIILYLHQEGRDIGLYSKRDVYELQIKGIDTFLVNKMLGFDDDLRIYNEAVGMLEAMDINMVEIMESQL